MSDHAKDRADWLIDAVAAATQNRTFLRGDPEADDVVIAAIEMNARKAFSVISDRAEAAEEELNTTLNTLGVSVRLADQRYKRLRAERDRLRELVYLYVDVMDVRPEHEQAVIDIAKEQSDDG